ncbi:MAG: hypothetical protein ACOZCL_03715 [Bacillota bacterium]
MKSIQSQIFWITILFFMSGFIHISLSLLGAICFILPFIQYLKYKDKVWCKYYCPRAGFFSKILSKLSLGLELPKLLRDKSLSKGVVIYFSVNMFFVLMSTIMVTIGNIQPIEQIRFLMAFPLPIQLPQLMDLNIAPSLIHLGYRIFSMMFTSVTIGLALGILYKPRTWCIICPINTLTK